MTSTNESKQWVWWFSDLQTAIYFAFREMSAYYQPCGKPKKWFYNSAIEEAEKDGRKILALSPRDIGYLEAKAELMCEE